MRRNSIVRRNSITSQNNNNNRTNTDDTIATAEVAAAAPSTTPSPLFSSGNNRERVAGGIDENAPVASASHGSRSRRGGFRGSFARPFSSSTGEHSHNSDQHHNDRRGAYHATVARDRENSNNSEGYYYNNTSTNFRSMLRAQVHRQSLNSKRMLQAVLVSDEIVEADHIGTTHSNISQYDIEMVPTLQDRLEMMEELLDEQEEEQQKIIEGFRTREKRWIIALIFAVVAMVVLVILMVQDL